MKPINQWKTFKKFGLDETPPVLTKGNFVKAKAFMIAVILYWIVAFIYIFYGEGSPVIKGILLFGMIIFNPGTDGIHFVFKSYERYLLDEEKSRETPVVE